MPFWALYQQKYTMIFACAKSIKKLFHTCNYLFLSLHWTLSKLCILNTCIKRTFFQFTLFMPVATKTACLKQRQFSWNIWRGNVVQKSYNNTPWNIFLIIYQFQNYFQKSFKCRRHLLNPFIPVLAKTATSQVDLQVWKG